MDNSKLRRNVTRKKRVLRVRKKLRGSAEKPRLTIHKSNKHIYAQVIDDVSGETLVGLGTLSKNTEVKKKSTEAAFQIGKQLAALAAEKGIQTVVFDRGRFKFHGLVAQLAQGAREAGLRF